MCVCVCLLNQTRQRLFVKGPRYCSSALQTQLKVFINRVGARYKLCSLSRLHRLVHQPHSNPEEIASFHVVLSLFCWMSLSITEWILHCGLKSCTEQWIELQTQWMFHLLSTPHVNSVQIGFYFCLIAKSTTLISALRLISGPVY